MPSAYAQQPFVNAEGNGSITVSGAFENHAAGIWSHKVNKSLADTRQV